MNESNIKVELEQVDSFSSDSDYDACEKPGKLEIDKKLLTKLKSIEESEGTSDGDLSPGF